MTRKRKKPDPMVISATRPPWHEAHRWWLAYLSHADAVEQMGQYLDYGVTLDPGERDALARHIQLTRAEGQAMNDIPNVLPFSAYKTPENFRGHINGLPMYVMRDEPDVVSLVRDEVGAEYVCIGVRLFSDMQVEAMRSMLGMYAKDNGPATARVHAAIVAQRAWATP